jgi:hypothetical protein
VIREPALRNKGVWLGEDGGVKVKRVGGESDYGAWWDGNGGLRGGESEARRGNDMWQAGWVCHADTQGFFYYGCEVGEGLDILFLFTRLGIIQKLGAEGLVSVFR